MRTRGKVSILASSLAIALLSGNSAQASIILPDATGDSEAFYRLDPVSLGAVIVDNKGVPSSASVLTSTAGANVSLTGSSATASSSGNAGGSATLTYSVAIAGPDAILVPVDVYAFLSSTVSSFDDPSNSGLAQLQIGNGVYHVYVSNDSGPIVEITDPAGLISSTAAVAGQTYSETISDVYTFTANDSYEVTVTANANSFSAGTNISSFVDPSFFIDPAFLLDNPGYSLVLSPGAVDPLPPAQGVPEPSSLAIFGAGAAALAFLRRKRPYQVRS